MSLNSSDAACIRAIPTSGFNSEIILICFKSSNYLTLDLLGDPLSHRKIELIKQYNNKLHDFRQQNLH